MTINEKISCCRKSNGYSQEALAELLGVSRQSVSKWETGEGMPEIGKLLPIANCFHVTTDCHHTSAMHFTHKNAPDIHKIFTLFCSAPVWYNSIALIYG